MLYQGRDKEVLVQVQLAGLGGQFFKTCCTKVGLGLSLAALPSPAPNPDRTQNADLHTDIVGGLGFYAASLPFSCSQDY